MNTSCKHPGGRIIWTWQLAPDQVDLYFCPRCRSEWLAWIRPLSVATLTIGWNFAPVPL